LSGHLQGALILKQKLVKFVTFFIILKSTLVQFFNEFAW